MEADARAEIIEFLSTLDLDCPVEKGFLREKQQPEILSKYFGNEAAVVQAAGKLQDQSSQCKNTEQLVSLLTDRMKADSRILFLLMYLFRQFRFTTVEAVHFMFETDRLNDLNYYKVLEASDPIFRQEVRNTLGAKWTKALLGEVGRDLHPEEELLVYKTTVYEYAGKQRIPENLWMSRVGLDPGVRSRIANFLVQNEGFDTLVENGSVVSQLLRNVKQVNVETVKRQRGRMGFQKVESVLKQHLEYIKMRTTVEELNARIRSGKQTFPPVSFVPEVRSHPLDKTFDFALLGKGGIGYLVESNYFTTGMSKPRSVSKEFQRLSENCISSGFGFIYVSDGIGWIAIDRTARQLFAHSEGLRRANPGRIPLFMNIEMLRRHLPSIVQTLKSEG